MKRILSKAYIRKSLLPLFFAIFCHQSLLASGEENWLLESIEKNLLEKKKNDELADQKAIAIPKADMQKIQQEILKANQRQLGMGKEVAQIAQGEIAQEIPPTEPGNVPENNLDEAQNITPIDPTSPPKTVLINFNNVNIIEYIRFISRITNKNFIFDENELQFNVTIISEEPTTIENIMTGLLQQLRIHDLTLVEEGNNIIIHRNPKVNSISAVITDDTAPSTFKDSEIVTKVFRLNTLDTEKAAFIVRPLSSENAIIEVLKESNILLITDLTANVLKITQLLKSLDSPSGGLVIGQFVINYSTIETLIPLAEQIIQPIARDQTLILVPQISTNSIFIISNPYLVERTIAIIQYLDQQQGSNRILELQNLQYEHEPSLIGPQTQVIQTPSGQWFPAPTSTSGTQESIFQPEVAPDTTTPPNGQWFQDENGNWYFIPGKGGQGKGPVGQWEMDSNGNWIFRSPERIRRGFTGPASLPGGFQKRGKFYIHKLIYRKGDTVERGLRNVAAALSENEKDFADVISAINSTQWIVGADALSFYGTVDALEKIRELMNDIDVPLRQVFLEMLILQTTIDDSLNYSVTNGTRFGGGNTSGSQGFIQGTTPLVGALNTTGVTGLGVAEAFSNGIRVAPVPFVPDGTRFANTAGFNLGVIGQKIVHCGFEFDSLGALVSALHTRRDDNIILNPKILTEDNTPAEIFVGINTPYQTQSIANDLGSIVTTNLQYQDVGTRLKVTPFIGNGDNVTLDILEEFSSIGSVPSIQSNATNTSFVGPTTNKNMTTTRVHLPSGFFLVISGLLQDEDKNIRLQTPCLGGIPLLGAFFVNKSNTDTKRNTMIFIRPQIIDTEDDIQRITKHNQDIWDYKHDLQNSWEYEVKEALDLFDVRRTLYPSDCGNCRDCDN